MDKPWVEMSENEKEAVIESKHIGNNFKKWNELNEDERKKVIEEIFRVYYECNLDVVGVKKE